MNHMNTDLCIKCLKPANYLVAWVNGEFVTTCEIHAPIMNAK